MSACFRFKKDTWEQFDISGKVAVCVKMENMVHLKVPPILITSGQAKCSVLFQELTKMK